MQILIVGAGITGISLAHLLEDHECSVKLIDSKKNVSSAVAAGIINPMVFRRMTMTWRAKEMMDFAEPFYRKLEEKLNQAYYHPLTIRRFFASEQEAGYWIKKQELEEYRPFLHPLTEQDNTFNSPHNTFGTGRVNRAAYVDARKFIETNWEYFSAKGAFINEVFDYAELNVSAHLYKEHSFDLIVFCEGKDAYSNPWFGTLPVEQTKGEVLTIKAPRLDQTESLNRKCFMLPIGENRFKVGSTYVWNTNNTEITEEGRKTIEEQLSSLISENYEVVDQIAGIRPTVKDRRPLLGSHPEFPALVFANGMGTKGYMIAPLLMYELSNHILKSKTLDPEVDLQRYLK